MDHPALLLWKGKETPAAGLSRTTGSLKNVSSYGTNEFTLASSETDPLHGGQVLYVFSGGYQCEDPVKFSIGATL